MIVTNASQPNQGSLSGKRHWKILPIASKPIYFQDRAADQRAQLAPCKSIRLWFSVTGTFFSVLSSCAQDVLSLGEPCAWWLYAKRNNLIIAQAKAAYLLWELRIGVRVLR